MCTITSNLQYLDRLAASPVPWFAEASADHDGIAICTRVRLARNVAGLAFPARASRDERRAVLDQVLAATQETLTADRLSLEIDCVSGMHRRVLSERRLISPEHESGEQERGVVVARDQRWSCMVNEEDHLRLQAIGPGLQVHETWRQCDELARRIESRVPYAYASDLGYLTACPSNLGTGLRASVMLHLPALVFCEQITSVMRGANQVGLVVRGLFGEGTETAGDLYQLSNQSTLGESETRLLTRVDQHLRAIIEHERVARQMLLSRCASRVYDKVGRSYGTLRHAYGLSTREALKHLSRLRLGMALGMFRNLRGEELRDLMITVLPGHLQALAGTAMDGQARSSHRAGLLRQRVIDAEGKRRGVPARA